MTNCGYNIFRIRESVAQTPPNLTRVMSRFEIHAETRAEARGLRLRVAYSLHPTIILLGKTVVPNGKNEAKRSDPIIERNKYLATPTKTSLLVDPRRRVANAQVTPQS